MEIMIHRGIISNTLDANPARIDTVRVLPVRSHSFPMSIQTQLSAKEFKLKPGIVVLTQQTRQGLVLDPSLQTPPNTTLFMKIPMMYITRQVERITVAHRRIQWPYYTTRPVPMCSVSGSHAKPSYVPVVIRSDR